MKMRQRLVKYDNTRFELDMEMSLYTIIFHFD